MPYPQSSLTLISVEPVQYKVPETGALILFAVYAPPVWRQAEFLSKPASCKFFHWWSKATPCWQMQEGAVRLQTKMVLMNVSNSRPPVMRDRLGTVGRPRTSRADIEWIKLIQQTMGRRVGVKARSLDHDRNPTRKAVVQ